MQEERGSNSCDYSGCDLVSREFIWSFSLCLKIGYSLSFCKPIAWRTSGFLYPQLRKAHRVTMSMLPPSQRGLGFTRILHPLYVFSIRSLFEHRGIIIHCTCRMNLSTLWEKILINPSSFYSHITKIVNRLWEWVLHANLLIIGSCREED